MRIQADSDSPSRSAAVVKAAFSSALTRALISVSFMGLFVSTSGALSRRKIWGFIGAFLAPVVLASSAWAQTAYGELGFSGSWTSGNCMQQSATVNAAIDAGGACGTTTLTTSTKTTNYPVVSGDTGKIFNNTGAAGEVDFTLPAAAAGLNYCFTVDAAQIVKVIAASGEKVAIGASNSTASGNFTSNAPFSTACFYGLKAGQWVARSVTGSWAPN